MLENHPAILCQSSLIDVNKDSHKEEVEPEEQVQRTEPASANPWRLNQIYPRFRG